MTKKPLHYLDVFHCQTDYKDMRILTEETYTALLAHFTKDETVALFQKLLLSKKVDDGAIEPDQDMPELDTVDEKGELE